MLGFRIINLFTIVSFLEKEIDLVTRETKWTKYVTKVRNAVWPAPENESVNKITA